ncbi:MAG: hypothetical protein ACFBSC_06125 [Microcoleaceae cyanobacterium]
MSQRSSTEVVQSLPLQSMLEPQEQSPEEAAFQARSLAIRQKLGNLDLAEADAWWRRIQLGDPHKYLLPIILARLSLEYNLSGQRPESITELNESELLDRRAETWDTLLKLAQDKTDLYHFRSPLDVRIFFLFRDVLPEPIEASYRQQLQLPKVLEWTEGGTENHMFMQRASGLALMNGSGFPVGDPASAATNEAWIRSELNKFLTIGQGEFHSSVYYGYSISGLLNLYDFAKNPELKKFAQALLDWFAINMALRLSWGTAGGAESRGFDRNTWDSGLAAVAWQWWGTGKTTEELKFAETMDAKHARLALPATLSSYRPPTGLQKLALKQVPLPFEARMSHPAYYSYDADNQLRETFYSTADYSLGTLLEPSRSYQVQGTIRAQYATYKLVVRDLEGLNNSVVSLGGTYHTPLATGRSPTDQLVQKRSAVIFQSRLNQQDRVAEVPARSSLVLPQGYGEPQRHQEWYIWKINNIWLCARVWADQVTWAEIPNQKQPVPTRKDLKFEGLTAQGEKMAWITDVAQVSDYPSLKDLTQALDTTLSLDDQWPNQGKLTYRSLLGDTISLTYNPDGAVGQATVNGNVEDLEVKDLEVKDLELEDSKNWPVIESPYVRSELNRGVLEINLPEQQWRLQGNLTGPSWAE